MPLTVSLEVPGSVDQAEIDPTNVLYDPVRTQVSLILKNTGSEPLSVPALAIAKTVYRTYRDPKTDKMQEFRIGEPPSDKPELLELEAGETWSYGLGFEYPEAILLTSDGPIDLELCAHWDKASLNPDIYPSADYEWVQSFTVCGSVQVLRPNR